MTRRLRVTQGSSGCMMELLRITPDIDIQTRKGTQVKALLESLLARGLALPGMWRGWTQID